MEYQESALWQRTLGAEAEGAVEGELIRLRAAFEQFRHHVAPLAADIALSVPGYTDHSVVHCDALWDTAGLICGPDFPINPAEAFVLGGAFLIHDLAMGLSAYKEGLKGIFTSQEWLDLLWAEHGSAASDLNLCALRDMERDPTWNGLTSPLVKTSLTTFLREMHARRAEEILMSEWSLTNRETFYLLPDTELRQWYGDVIGKVARSHWLDVAELEEFLPGTLGTPSNLPLDWTVDPVKIACVLRLADASQIDARRAQPLHTPFRNPQGASRDHWIFQERMLLPRYDRGRLEFTAARAFHASEAEAWWLAFDTVSMVHGELTSVDSLCADLGKPRMQARAAAGAEAPERFARYVPTQDWTPIDARPHIRNPLAVIESLGGSALYGQDEDEVPLRELLANASDASRARMAAQPDAESRPIRINFARDEKGDVLEVRDYGIGMSADSIVNYLCDFGSSGWRSPEFREEYPGALSTGYTSTGQYGIGFFSVFMIADEVTVISRPLHGAWDDTYVLEFPQGVTHRPILRRALRAERLNEPGTLVRLRLLDPLDGDYGLLFAGRALSPDEQCTLVQKMALTCSYPIDVSPLGSTEYVSVIGSSPWQLEEAEKLYVALHSGPYSRYNSADREFGRRAFRELLSPLTKEGGEIVGRLAFRGPSLQDRLSQAECYCGGFRSAGLYELVGVVVGKPKRAGRDMVELDISVESLQDWCRAQWDLLRSADWVTVEDLLRFQWFSGYFGVVDDAAPLCYSRDGLLSPSEIRLNAKTSSQIDLIEGNVTSSARIDDKQWLFLGFTGKLVQLPENTLAVNYSSLGLDSEYPEAKCRSPIMESDPDPRVMRSFEIWNDHSFDPDALVIKCLSEVWECSIADILRTRVGHDIANGADDRVWLDTIDGKKEPTRAFTYRRPGA